MYMIDQQPQLTRTLDTLHGTLSHSQCLSQFRFNLCVCVCVCVQPMPSEALCGQLQVFSAALQQAVQIIYAKEIEVSHTYMYIYPGGAVRAITHVHTVLRRYYARNRLSTPKLAQIYA